MYYLIFFILICCFGIDLKVSNKYLRRVYFGVFLILLAFSGFRYKVGYDYENYELIFNYVEHNLDIFVEPLFLLLIKSIHFLKGDTLICFFVIALLAIGIKFKFLWKYSSLPFLSILLYYCRIYLNSDFGQVRQGIALGIILWTYPFIVKRDFFKFLVLVVISSLFHAAAILFVPIYFLANKITDRFKYLLFLILSIPLALFDFKVILVSVFSSILPGDLFGKLVYYSENEEDLGLTLSVFLRVFIVLFCLAYFWQLIQKDEKFRIVFNIYFMGVIFYLIFNSLPQLGGRGSLYFQQFELLLMPFIIVNLKGYIKRTLFIIFIMVYCFWGVITLLKSATPYTPYYFEPYLSIFN